MYGIKDRFTHEQWLNEVFTEMRFHEETVNAQISYDKERIEKLERAVKLILALDGQPEVYPPRDISLKTWVVRLDPKAQEQLQEALQA